MPSSVGSNGPKKSPAKDQGSRPRSTPLSPLFLERIVDRQKVNAAVEHRAELTRTGRTAWLYLNDYEHGKQRNVGDPEWVKVFASAEAADRWFDKHDPEGVAWEYEVEGGQRQTSVWIHLADENSRAIGDASGPSSSPPSRPPTIGSSRTLPTVGPGHIRSTIKLSTKRAGIGWSGAKRQPAAGL